MTFLEDNLKVFSLSLKIHMSYTCLGGMRECLLAEFSIQIKEDMALCCPLHGFRRSTLQRPCPTTRTLTTIIHNIFPVPLLQDTAASVEDPASVEANAFDYEHFHKREEKLVGKIKEFMDRCAYIWQLWLLA